MKLKEMLDVKEKNVESTENVFACKNRSLICLKQEDVPYEFNKFFKENFFDLLA